MGSWLVADADTGAVLAAKAPHARFLPASTLKTLTALTLLPLLDPASTTKARSRTRRSTAARSGSCRACATRSTRLFTAMLVVSGNDAADALAEAAGGIPHTVDLMNAEALHLQAFDTFARTPSGLDAPGESTSAYDLALIARAGLAMPDVPALRVASSAARCPRRTTSTSRSTRTTGCSRRYRGDIGVKNGYTVEAGATYVGAATRNGHTIIVTLMNAPPDFWPQAKALLDLGIPRARPRRAGRHAGRPGGAASRSSDQVRAPPVRRGRRQPPRTRCSAATCRRGRSSRSPLCRRARRGQHPPAASTPSRLSLPPL